MSRSTIEIAAFIVAFGATALIFSVTAKPALAQNTEEGGASVRAEPTGRLTGQLTVRFTRYAKQAEFPHVIGRVAGEAAARQADAELAKQGDLRHTVDLRGETYNIYIPAHYDGSTPFGLFVFVSPLEEAGPPKAFIGGLDRGNMIFVGANRSGNNHDVLARRIPLALHAVDNMTAKYNIDPQRIYAGGVSGGAKVAGFLGVSFGDIFKGAMHIVGSEPVGEGKILLPDGALGEQIKADNRYVFVTGKNDFNRKDVRKHARRYRTSGFANVQLYDIKNMGHTAPTGKNFERALKALDGIN